jgi:hypothetical protein
MEILVLVSHTGKKSIPSGKGMNFEGRPDRVVLHFMEL